MKNWYAPECSEDEVRTMIQGVITELNTGDTSYSVYVGGDRLVFGTKSDHGTPEVYECRIIRTNLDKDDVDVLSAPVAVNRGFPS